MIDKNKQQREERARIAHAAGDHVTAREIEQELPLYKKVAGTKRIVVNHKQVAITMVKFIATLPDVVMPKRIKDIMALRLLGIAPTYRPFTHMECAIYLGMRIKDIEDLEAEGKLIATHYLKKIGTQEAAEKFEREVKPSNLIINGSNAHIEQDQGATNG